ncbi:MAG: hypothetical protein IMZ52_10675, partial [Actinobacteria bacterium]|nr:hypothetical protein [Actinomycetota bacterium]
MREEPVKEFSLSGPGYYMSMDITKKGGSFTIDDKMGWYWSGTDDTFLTGLVRVQSSKMYEDFLKEIAESKIRKSDIKKAIIHSLNKDRKDGLYPLLGDNRVREGWDDFTDSIWSDESSEIESCLKQHGYGKDVADKIADDIVDHGASKLKSSRQNFDEYEKELARDFLDKKKPWNDVMKGIVNACDKQEKTVDKFIKCIGDEVSEFKLNDPEAQFERESDAWHSRYHVTKKAMKEISEKHN